jgi:hypothetical protein
MIRRTIEQRRAALAHSNALATKRETEHRIALLRGKALAAHQTNDAVTVEMLNAQFRSELWPAFQQASAAVRSAKAELDAVR